MDFTALFQPKSIALIGASREPSSVGYSLLENLLHSTYTGAVYPVNPKTDTIMDKTCYRSIASIPDSFELGIIAIPAPFVLGAAQEAIEKGAKALIVISAGFKEQGIEGKQREDELANLCKEKHVLLTGPNCLGILNPHIGLNASFETVLPQKGSIMLISQSGALISSLLDIANERGIGFSNIISVGNKASLTELELLPFAFNDEKTSVVAIYSESLTNAPELISLIHKNISSAHPKPVILLKAGVTQEGQLASSSHTGSLAGSDMAYEALVKQAGIIRVYSMDDLLTTAHVFATNPLPEGNKTAIVTNAGGPGILATDAASRLHLTLSHFDPSTEEQLTAVLPPNAHPKNPVDLLGDARSERYEKVLRIVAADQNVDSIVVIVTPQTMTDIPETAASIIRVRNDIQKPITVSCIGATQTDEGDQLLSITKIAHSQFPEPLITAVSHLTAFSYLCVNAEKRKEPIPKHISFDSIAFPDITGRTQLDTGTVFQILSTAGLPVVSSVLVQSEREAQEKAGKIGNKLAMKIVSRDIVHKSDIGGVLLSVSPDNAQQAFTTIMNNIRLHAPKARTDGVLVTEMIEGEGIEFFLGVKKEPHLGSLILAGLGGIYVEVLRDITARFAPVSESDAYEMAKELKAYALLQGTRGKEALDTDSFVHMIMSLSDVALSLPGIMELDINPVFVRPKGQGAVIVDARITIESAAAP